ncbi:MAG: RNA-binding domain-containing protein [Rhodomicrobium sp.]
MDEKALRGYLLTAYPKEDDACEWKEYKNLKNAWNSHQGDDVESYISAIANMHGGQLVLGVKDGTLDIVGIQEFGGYTVDNVRHRLAGRCANLNTEKLKVEAFTTLDTGKTVWIIHVPHHEPRLPVYAHGKTWQRLDESLVPMRPERLKAILAEAVEQADWSAFVVERASVSDLDEAAVATAREKFKEKNARQPWKEEIDKWDVVTFLDKVKLTAHGKITRAALLLLGKPDAIHFLSPHPAQITWRLDADEKAYEHFGPPFILTTTEVLKRVRNLSQKLFPHNQLLAVEIPKYDTRTILEGLHNCLAHQDYESSERVLVTETPDRLIFENAGAFVEGCPEDYLTGKRTPKRYRNAWLAQAMAQIGMIDTMGYGIHTMTISQRERYLPLPGYRGSTSTSTHLEVLGRPIDLNYSQLLLERHDLDLDTVILLDRVQKGLPIADHAAARLRREGLLEGRRPNLHVSARVAAATETEVTYSLNKGMNKAQLKQIVLTHLMRFGTATRPKLDDLILPMLPSGLSNEQKVSRVKNLLLEMRTKDQSIVSEGRGPGAIWRLAK